jgi:hypothetical protein
VVLEQPFVERPFYTVAQVGVRMVEGNGRSNTPTSFTVTPPGDDAGMVAITHPQPQWYDSESARHRVELHPVGRAADGGHAVPTFTLSSLLMALVVATLVVVVAVGTVAFGRVLDSHRGIPAASATNVEAAPAL